MAGALDMAPFLGPVADGLRERGAEVEVIGTQHPGEILTIGQRAVAGACDAVFFCGGDGSLGEGATALAGSRVALGVLPAGTGNVWAKQMGLPIAPLLPGYDPGEFLLRAAEAQLDGTARRVDVGQVGERRFLLWAGVGLDAFITHGVEPRPRAQKRLGMFPYMLAAVILATQFGGMRAQITVDGKRIKGRMLLVVASNTQLYMGGLVRIDPQARLDDGLLDVWVFYGLGVGWTVRQMAGLFAGRHLRDPHVRHLRGRHIAVTARPPADLHLDGDPTGTTPVVISVLPRALSVLVPASAPGELFLDSQASG